MSNNPVQVELPQEAPGHWETDEGRQIACAYAKRSRDSLCMGDRPDFVLANDVFMTDRNELGFFAFQTAAKERIRWLSAQLALANARLTHTGDRRDMVLPVDARQIFEAGFHAAERGLGFEGCDESAEALEIEWDEYRSTAAASPKEEIQAQPAMPGGEARSTTENVGGADMVEGDDASPRPWRVVPYGDGDSLVIHDARGDFRVCFMATPGDSPGSWEQIKANARLIIRAVNGHDTASSSRPNPAAELPWHGARPEAVCEAIAQFWAEWEEDRAGKGAYLPEELAEDGGSFANDLYDRLASLSASSPQLNPTPITSTEAEATREAVTQLVEALRKIAGNNWRDQSRARYVARQALADIGEKP